MAIISLLLIVGTTVVFVLNIKGLNVIAKRLNINKPWLAYIPVANCFTIGRIGEEVTKNYERKPKKYALLLLCLFIILKVIKSISIFYVMYYTVNLSQFNPLNYYYFTIWINIFSIGFTVVYFVLFCIVLFKLYKYVTAHYVLFTVLSVLFGLAPFFIFFLRNSENEKLVHKSNQALENGEESAPTNPSAPPNQQPFAPQVTTSQNHEENKKTTGDTQDS